MAKRRLSKNQTRRIQKKQRDRVERANNETFEDDALGPEQKGRVIAHFGTQVDVQNSENRVVRCFLRANLDAIVTGDRVIWRNYGDSGVVESCEERTALLSRPDSYGKLKPVAANVDQIIVTIAPKPEFFTNLIDRYLVVAEINQIKPVVLINKADLIEDDNRTQFQELQALYAGLGYEVLSISAKFDQGMNELKSMLADKTSIFVGQSGVGKSSIIQRLLPEEDIQIGSLSDAKTKGKHTTTFSQLFRFEDGGECIDSPGIREFGLWHLDESDVINGFIELSEIASLCKFRDCKHENEPGCAIKHALAENKISKIRFHNYQRIIASLDDVEVKNPL